MNEMVDSCAIDETEMHEVTLHQHEECTFGQKANKIIASENGSRRQKVAQKDGVKNILKPEP